MRWDEIGEKSERSGGRIKSVFQEEMQKAVLTALSNKGCFNSIVFQGGTALRLFHGNPRFSEDIDLVLRNGIDQFGIDEYLPFVRKFCHDTFPFLDTVEAKIQKDEPHFHRYIIKAISDDPEKNIRIHIEMASIPSYYNSPRILDFPPLQPAVRVEDTREILADKICALALRPYLKGRDLWDIYFLAEESSVELKWELVRRKIKDYNEPVSELKYRLEGATEKIREDGVSIMGNELERFLPKHVLDNYRSSYDQILDSIMELISNICHQQEENTHEG